MEGKSEAARRFAEEHGIEVHEIKLSTVVHHCDVSCINMENANVRTNLIEDVTCESCIAQLYPPRDEPTPLWDK